MVWGWNKDIHLHGMVDGQIMVRDRILRRRREYKEKKEIEGMIRRVMSIEMERRIRKEKYMEGKRGSVKKEAKMAKNGTNGEIEDKEVK